MKMKNIIIIQIAFALTCVCFTACENPIIGKWWDDDEEIKLALEQELDYVALIKNIPIYEAIIEEKIIYEYIYETIFEYINLPPLTIIEYVEKPLPPEILLQHIKVVDIEFILFSGDQKEYNKPSSTGGTNLKDEEVTLNNLIVKEMADSLIDNPNQLIILHGHANPVTYTSDELKELEELSKYRAGEVGNQLKKYSVPDLEKRMTVRGYGGGKNISGSGSSYAGLNRRVEMILIEIETIPGSGSQSKKGQ